MDFHDTILVCEENLDVTTTYITKQQQTLAQALANHLLTEHISALLDLDKKGWHSIEAHGDFLRWSQGLNALPDVQADVDISHQVCVQRVAHTDIETEKVTQIGRAPGRERECLHVWNLVVAGPLKKKNK